MSHQEDQAVAQAAFVLREILAPNATFYLTTVHTTRSGSGRWLKVLAIESAEIIDISDLVGRALRHATRLDGTFFVSNQEMQRYGGTLTKPLTSALYPAPNDRRGLHLTQKEI